MAPPTGLSDPPTVAVATCPGSSGTVGTQPLTVPLEPGQVATATVDGSDNPVGGATSCPFYPALLVTVPDETRPVILSGVGWQGPEFATQGFPGCSPLVVTPVVPGDSGTYP